jgi:S-(hydroxymethyl)glutathione dehydrogenase/alcohol dehydrogenase
MRASVLYEQGKPLGVEELALESPRAGEVHLYLAGKLKVDQLITRRYGLDEANEAFRALAAGELARGLIVF